MNRFLNAPAPRGRVASGAPRCAPLEPTPLPNRLRHVRARDPRPRLHTPRNAPRLKDCRTPPGPPPNPNQCLSQRGKVGISSIRHWHGHMRSPAHSLNPPARGYLSWPNATFFVRQCRAPLRSSRSGYAPATLTALKSLRPIASPTDGHHRLSLS